MATAPHAESIARRLMACANTSGGWGYFAGKASRLEPTCWALAALRAWWPDDDAAWASFAAPHLAHLTASQRATGFITDTAEAPPNLAAEGLAAWFLASRPASDNSTLARLLDAIVGLKGVALPAMPGRQDNSLQAWPWYPDTFSWVEPTAWCVIALKKSRRQDAAVRARLDEAHRVLDNRCCDAGGWNYGNASALGQDLRPHVPPTATALIALQDVRSEAVSKSLQFLESARLKEDSGLALALAAIALRVHGRPAADVEARLADVSERTAAHGNQHALAAVLYALTAAQHGAEAFRVA